MWRNFRNVGSAMQAIGNVVAPPVDDDDDEGSYYDDDEEGEEEGEEEELDEADDINSQDNDPQWRQNHEAMDQVQSERVSPLKAGFGFVGMIARALDRGEEEEDDDEEYYEDEDDGQEVVELYRDETANEMQQIIPTNDEIDGMKSSTPPPPPEETQISQQQPSREEGDGWDDIHTTWTTNESLTQNDAENGSQMEKRPSIQRETGSVSPVSPSRKNVHSPSPNNAPSNSVEASNLGNVESLQSRLPDLLIEQPSNESADIPDEPQQIDKAEEERPDISNNISLAKYEQKLSMDSQEQPETEAPVSESNSQAPEISGGSPAVSSQDSAIYKEKRRGSYKFESDEKPQIRRSSKVSLSDARFLAEPPRADELETVDRWAAPKSTSIRQKGRTSSKDNNNIVSSRHSLDSYFDDSSLSSVSSHNRVGKRKEQGRGTKSDQQIHLSASSPALASNSNPAKVDRAQITATEAEDRFRAEPVRPSADDLPTRDTRFVSTRSHVSPPPEPQRQASRRQWSQGSSKNKADAINANIIEAGRNKADFETVVTGPAGSMIPPRNPRRTQSTEEESSVPEVDPKVNSRPPLVAGNSRDADVLPRRPVQRMHSLTEENTNQEDLDTSGSALDITGTSNGVRPLVSGEKMQACEVEKRCIELENQLREMTEAKQMFEEKFKQEEASREALLYAFQEKEARLFNANAEENEQVVRELTAEMERRVGEISSLLEDQQRQHESERAEWQEMLKEAEDQLNAIGEGDDTTEQVSRLLEDQQRQHENDRAEWQELLSQAEEEIEKLKKQKGKNDLDISEHVSSLMEDQERQHESDRAEWQRLLNETEEQLELARKENREFQAKLENSTVRNQQRYDRDLRIAEDKLAQTMALLDEREEQIVQLKNMVKSMSAEVNEHREGVQEVEDEADELRHQTEVLQHRLDTKTAECSELHEELTKLQSEVDRMANLKVSSCLRGKYTFLFFKKLTIFCRWSSGY